MEKQTEGWKFPKSKLALIGMLLKDITGLSAPSYLFQHREQFSIKGKRKKDIIYLLKRTTYYLIAIFFIGIYGVVCSKNFLLYWIVPLVTWLNFIFHIRSISEHSGFDHTDGVLGGARTVLLSKFEQFLWHQTISTFMLSTIYILVCRTTV